MIKKIISFVAIQAMILGSLTAQNFVGKINPYPIENTLELSSNDTLKIIAVMVEFQQDNDPTTFGNGKFGSIYTEDYGNTIIDPLPFDKNYFDNHLQFAKNYYSRVSKGNVIIDFTILPEIITVSKTIRNYSPEVQSSDLTNVANFAKEVWELADQKDYDFSDYDLFAVFHAGVGRDISLPGSIGNERDIPSVYLSPNSLSSVFGEGFNGFQSNGKLINNTMILPSTESRELEGIGGSVLIELSINGLIVASIASHLGLPDLFDTETGKSAIGRFGLMDGQAIFGYGGLFPPEPSAWEKIYLGWETPVVVSYGTNSLDLAASMANDIAPKIYKIPLSSTEYYLVENRQRDVNKDGSTITYFSDGEVKSINFPKDTTGYESFDISDVSGVVIDVDEYDWALPGSGILIWHIDENVINEKLASNSINNDKARRGVDVEEADGIQDIGEEFTTIFGDVIIGEGSDQDLWYQGNRAELYKNKFDPTSKPNTNTNSGANSLISFTDFSESANLMTFKVSFASENVDLQFEGNYNHNLVFAVSNSKIYGLKDNDLLVVPFSQMLPTIFTNIADFSKVKPASLFNNNERYLFGVFDNKLNVYRDGDAVLLKTVQLSSNSSTVPAIVKVNNQDIVIVSSDDNNVHQFVFDPNTAEVLTLQNSFNAAKKVSQTAYLDGLFIAAQNELISQNSLVGNHQFSSDINYFSTYANSNSEIITVVLLNDYSFRVLKNDEVISEFTPVNKKEVISFAIADVLSSGENQIIFTSDKSLNIVSLDGASVDNFPYIVDYELSPFINVLDLQNDGSAEILFYDKMGNVYLVSSKDGKLIYNFPLSIGEELGHNPILFDNSSVPGLFLLDKNGNYRIYNLNYPNNFTILYSEEYGNSANNSVFAAAKNSNIITEFFPDTKAYNWPNPVYDNETYIRFYVSDDSNAEIKIFDLAGDLVGELSSKAIGGMENEITWNVQNIQSGVYFAHLEVKSSSGKSAYKIIKIAVIK
ncbi:MAG: T9SS type A sorting domain-containing protein [Melioribacteraceae bacterium]|nr:T9SS type A sorting domain-containing protein [Melioribacteraceae bacterium]